jgi:hypothetical protein
MFCNYDQNNWYELLPLAEYAYNNSVTSATGFTPFYANYGYNPKTTWLKQADAKIPAATYYAHWMEQVHRRCLEQLERTRDQMGTYYNRTHASPPPFQPGDKVMLESKNLRTVRPSKKLDHKMVGPFPILEMVGTHAARLKLPKTMKCHNVFHVSLLEPYRENKIQGRPETQPGPIKVSRDNEYEVERILRAE